MSNRDHSAAPPDAGVSRLRLLALRALYALIVLGQLLFIWPALLARLPDPAHYQGIVLVMLAAFSIMCALGLRYPLQMIPVLLWELLWKAMWLALVALPQWRAGTMSEAARQTAFDCSLVVLVLVALPWGYVWRNYVRKPAERAAGAAEAAA